MLGGRDEVGVDGLDVARVGLAAPALHEPLDDGRRLVDLLLRDGRQAQPARRLGDEGQRGHRHPGEVFAETYRLLNEQRLGLTITPWLVVDESLQPDTRALQLVQQDVTSPWTSNQTTTLRGTFTRRGSSLRTFKVSTPYDGTLATSVRAARGERLRINVHTATICGARTMTLRVTRTAGAGAFSVAVSRP